MSRSNDTIIPGLGFKTSAVEDLEAFDILPPPIRKAIAAHPHQMASEPILAAWSDPDFRPDLDCVERMDLMLAAIRDFKP